MRNTLSSPIDENPSELAERIAICVERLGGQTKAAKVIGISQPGLRNWSVGDKLPQSFGQIARLAQEADVSLDWLLTGIERDTSSLRWIPILDGAGSRPFDARLVKSRVTRLEDTAVYVVEGREMEEYIKRGDAVVIDRGDRDLLKAGMGVYLLRRGGGYVLTRALAEISGTVQLWTHRDPAKVRYKADAVANLDVVGRVALTLSEP